MMYIILWRDRRNYELELWSAYHPVWHSLEVAKEWVEEYKKEYGEHYEYKLSKLTFLD